MIIIRNVGDDAETNFSIEDYLMDADYNLEETALMLWNTPPTAMVGKFQNVAEEINGRYIKENDIRVVRRSSGGGTIFTDRGTVQFTVASPTISAGNQDPFREFIEPVVKALRKLGLNAEFNSRNDIMIDGKKVSGNAQYRKNGKTLHHGSILFDVDGDVLGKVITVSDDKIKSKGIKSVRERVGNIREMLSDDMNFDEFVDFLIEELKEDNCKDYFLTDEELEKIQEIKAAKYGAWDWTYGQSPKSEIIRKRRVMCGMFRVGINLEHYRIKDIDFSGDFFVIGDLEEVKATLRGVMYDRVVINDVIQKNNLAKHFAGLTNPELWEIII